MKKVKVGIFYATSSGRTKKVAGLIAARFYNMDVTICPLSEHKVSDLFDFDFLIFGNPTYGKGELHHQWQAWKVQIENLDLSLKTVAIFVLGDQKYHKRSFAGSLPILVDMVKKTKARLIEASGESGISSNPNLLELGLIIDEVNQQKLTIARVNAWVENCSGFFLLQNTKEDNFTNAEQNSSKRVEQI